MADEQPSLHIDTDWKKQAQEEKRKLAEQEQKRSAEKEAAKVSIPPLAADPGSGMAGGPSAAANTSARARAGSPAARGERAIPAASFATLVSSLVTQVLLYIGDLTPRGAEPQVNLDLAKFNIDLLGVIEEKTKNNLAPDEQKMLDNALYEVRMRFVSVSQQYATI